MTAELSPSNPTTKFSLYPLFWAAIAFGFGIVLAQISGVDWRVWLGSAVVLGIVAFVARGSRSGRYLALLTVFFAGAFIQQFQIANVAEDRIKRIYEEGRIASGTPVEIEGRLIGLPEPAYDGAVIRLKAFRIVATKNAVAASGQVRMFVPLSEPEQKADLASLDLRSGATIRTACELLREDQYLNPGVMPRRQLLDQQGIDATCTVKSPLLIEVVAQPTLRSPFDLVYEQRAKLIEEFRERLSPQAAGVMIASLLGDKHYLDKDTAEVFRDGGTFHVLVISGLHITFIGGLIYWLVSVFTRNRFTQFIVVCGALWLYTLAVGAEVPVVRASIMFTVLLLGRALYRQGTLLNTLGLCCLILLAWRPADLFTPSFQLTVVSVGAIVGMAFPLIEKLRSIGSWLPDASSPFPPNVPNWLRRFCETLYWRPHVWDIEKGRQIWRARIFKSPLRSFSDVVRGLLAYLFEGVLVSLIVQLWMLPLLVYYFHRVSPISVLLNIWVGVVIAAESFAALLAVLFAELSVNLATPFSMLTNGLNWLLIEFPRLFSDLGWASFRVPIYPGFGKTICIVYFIPVVVLGAILYRWEPFALRRPGSSAMISASASGLAVVILACLIVFHPLSAPKPDGRLMVEFLDVGQGDSTFITFPNGETMLIDGGGRVSYSTDNDEDEPFEPDAPRIGEMVVSECLWGKGYSHVDHLVVTHADADHSQGLADVIRNFSVGSFSFGAWPSGASELDDVLHQAATEAVPIKQIGSGDELEIGGVRIEVLWPIKGQELTGSDNNGSVVIRLVYGDHAFLLTGDIERESEAAMVAGGAAINTTVVKVPHHGSRTSSTLEFINAVSTKIAVIPVGRRSLYGHPHSDVVDRWKAAGVTVKTTGEKGTISFSTDGSSM
ncbi:MAG: ComEC/Rec2 family competence protein, partial [Pyrinomonadaceae bacterium]